ncbi:cobaltochelatase subunit CobN, partial [Rhizobium ruizarguesonis]
MVVVIDRVTSARELLGGGEEGRAERGLFEERLRSVQDVIQNQDNREHDLLDSDDYYQFEGG